MMVIHFASMHNSKQIYFFQNAQFSKPSKLRGMMPRKVNYSMHFACTHYNIGVIGLIIDGDFQVSIVIAAYKSHIIQDLSNNFLIFIIYFSFFLSLSLSLVFSVICSVYPIEHFIIFAHLTETRLLFPLSFLEMRGLI